MAQLIGIVTRNYPMWRLNNFPVRESGLAISTEILALLQVFHSDKMKSLHSLHILTQQNLNEPSKIVDVYNTVNLENTLVNKFIPPSLAACAYSTL